MKKFIKFLLASIIIVLTASACNNNKNHGSEEIPTDTSEIFDNQMEDSLPKIDSLEIISDTLAGTNP